MKFKSILFILMLSTSLLGCDKAIRDLLDYDENIDSSPSTDANHGYGVRYEIGVENHVGKDIGSGLKMNFKTSVDEHEASHSSGYKAKMNLSEQSIIQ